MDKTLSPPVNRLPSELLASIFHIVLHAHIHTPSQPRDYPMDERTSYASGYLLTLLASVCVRWRFVVTGTPTFWSGIDIKNINLAELHIQRSRDAPLFVKLKQEIPNGIDKYGAKSRKNDLLSARAKELLLTGAPRFRSLDLDFVDSGCAVDWVSALLPRLSKSRLSDLIIACRHDSDPVIPVDGPIPSLESLHTLRLHNFPMLSSQIVCRNLLELALVYPDNKVTSKDLVPLLDLNPGLRSLTLVGGAHTSDRGRLDQASLHLPELRSIAIKESTRGSFASWFFRALVPGSYDIDLYLAFVSSYGRGPNSPSGGLISFFQRASVTSLHLDTVFMQLQPLLKHLPHLRHLRFTKCVIDLLFDNTVWNATTLTQLHTIEFCDCALNHSSRIPVALQAILALPSLQSVNHLRSGFSLTPEGWKIFQVPFGEKLAGKVTESQKLGVSTDLGGFR